MMMNNACRFNVTNYVVTRELLGSVVVEELLLMSEKGTSVCLCSQQDPKLQFLAAGGVHVKSY